MIKQLFSNIGHIITSRFSWGSLHRRLRPRRPRRRPRCPSPRVPDLGPARACARRRGTRPGTCSSTIRRSCRSWGRARRTTHPGTCRSGATPCRTRTRAGSTCSPEVRRSPRMNSSLRTEVQGVQSPGEPGLVDFYFGCSTLCPVLPGLMGNWQNRLSSWIRWWNIPNQS